MEIEIDDILGARFDQRRETLDSGVGDAAIRQTGLTAEEFGELVAVAIAGEFIRLPARMDVNIESGPEASEIGGDCVLVREGDVVVLGVAVGIEISQRLGGCARGGGEFGFGRLATLA